MKRRQLMQVIAGLGIAAAAILQPAAAQNKELKIGVTAGPHEEIMEVVKKVAAKDGLKLDIKVFSDYIQPNAALADGSLDVNSYQHAPYLNDQIATRGYKLSNVALTVTFPIAIYSNKVKSPADLKEGARIGIPNDPTNGGRALLLLQHFGLIKLKANAGLKATPLDVASNPKKFRLVELDAAQLPRSLDDFDAAVINGNYAQAAGMSPVNDSIALEPANGPYANLIAVRTADKDQAWVAKLIKAYHNPEVKKFITDKYKGSVISAW